MKPILAAAAAALAALAFAGTAGAVQLQTVATGFSRPVFLTQPAGEPGNLYVVEQTGRVQVLIDGQLRFQPFLDLSSQVSSDNEQGLLSMVFDPAYPTNHFVYVDYTDLNGDTHVTRYTSDGTTADTSTGVDLLFVPQPYTNHNGGLLQFGPDGDLYVGMGDGGSSGDPQNHAQDVTSNLGKLLKIDLASANPTWKIAGLGLRNPWRYSFDRSNGDLYLADVGQNKWEELDYVSASSQKSLLNFGWNIWEGSSRYKSGHTTSGRLTWPVLTYAHTHGRCAITGGYVYRGSTVTDLRGKYVFGDYCSGWIATLKITSGRASTPRTLPFTVPSLTSFAQDRAGELYALSQGGTIYMLVP